MLPQGIQFSDHFTAFSITIWMPTMGSQNNKWQCKLIKFPLGAENY